MNDNLDCELISRETGYSGFLRLDRHHLRHSSFHGGWCKPIVRERIEGLAAASILLYDPHCDAVILVEQFRIGLLGQAERPWCIETVSGFCDKAHETPEQVARREVVEETGCELLDLEAIGEFYVSPGISVERISLFCGRVDATKADGIHGLEHEGEEMRVVILPFAEAVAELFGRLESTSIIMTMQWLQVHRERLRAKWR